MRYKKEDDFGVYKGVFWHYYADTKTYTTDINDTTFTSLKAVKFYITDFKEVRGF